mgnify:CR=1 FL=1
MEAVLLVADVLDRESREMADQFGRHRIRASRFAGNHYPVGGRQGFARYPHLAEVGFFQDVEHPTEGPIRTMAVPTQWSHSKPAPTRLAPVLGQHSVDVLREAGLSQAQIDDLLARGVTLDGAG